MTQRPMDSVVFSPQMQTVSLTRRESPGSCLNFTGRRVIVSFQWSLQFVSMEMTAFLNQAKLTVTADELEYLAQADLDQQCSTGSKENLELASRWFHDCLTHHASCRPLLPDAWLPTRLLDVGSAGNLTIRLVDNTYLSKESQYVALSHRWGTSEGFVLTSDNKPMLEGGVCLTEVPETVRDAVAVTRALGLRYLWIDSMCIVQNDQGDWHQEAITMSKVYGLATCTIAATNSGFDNTGYFTTRNQYRFRPCRVPNPFKMNSRYEFYIRSQYLSRIHARDVKDSLWYNRGWVFQERTLSPRLLIFSQTQIMWACEHLQAAETWPRGKTSENHIDQFESFEVEKSRFHELLDNSNGVIREHSAWWTFLQDYVKSAKLKFLSDRLVAIQGIATLVQTLTGQNYCGGFWLNDDLPSSLVWTVNTPMETRPVEYRAPSWSWAAADGPINFNGPSEPWTTDLMQLVEHTTLPGVGRDKGDRKTKEALLVKGNLLEAAIMTSLEGTVNKMFTTPEYAQVQLEEHQRIRRQDRRQDGRQDKITRKRKGWLYTVRTNYVAPTLEFLAIILSCLIGACVFPFWFLYDVAIREIFRSICEFIEPCWDPFLSCLLGSIFSIGLCVARMLHRLLHFRSEHANNIRAQRKAHALNVEARERREMNERRTQRVFADLELGIAIPKADEGRPSDESGKDRDEIQLLDCVLDVYLPREIVLPVYLLPAVKMDSNVVGLVLRLTASGEWPAAQYERMGIFKMTSKELNRLLQRQERSELLLV